MDSGWAVVLGATIALVGSAIVPWIREATGRRTSQNSARRNSLQKLIPRILELITQHIENVHMKMWAQNLAAKETRAMVQLSLLLRPDEWKVAAILMQASMHADKDDAARFLGAATAAMSAWFSGAQTLNAAARGFEDSTESILTR